MPALQRLAAAAGAAAVALALTGAALGAPALLVSTSHVVEGTGPAAIATREDPGTYRTTVVAPTAYRLPKVRWIGKQIGAATIHVATAAGALTFTGWIVGADPAGYLTDQCADFAGDSHLAVWVAQVRQVDGIARAEVPIYVDQGPGGRTELTWCASSAADMTVTGVSLRFDGIFLNPAVAGNYVWTARFDNAQSTARGTLGAATTSATAVVEIRRS